MYDLSYPKFILSLAIVLGLLYLCLWLLRRFGVGQAIVKNKKNDKQLEILETLNFDARRKFVRLRDGEKEHLILTSPHTDFLIRSKPHEKTVGEIDEKPLN